MRGVLGFGYAHPLGAECLTAAPRRFTAPHLAWVPAAGREPPWKVRVVPPPTALWLSALDDLIRVRGALPADCPPERRGLCVDAGEAYLGLQHAFFRPVASGGPREASPLLFPHTSDASAASLAAIEFNLRGPALAVRGDHGRTLVHTAGLLLRGGLADVVLAGAVHYSDSLWESRARAERFAARGVPSADCAVAVLLNRDFEEHDLVDDPDLDLALGDTGPCRPLWALIRRIRPAGPPHFK